MHYVYAKQYQAALWQAWRQVLYERLPATKSQNNTRPCEMHLAWHKTIKSRQRWCFSLTHSLFPLSCLYHFVFLSPNRPFIIWSYRPTLLSFIWQLSQANHFLLNSRHRVFITFSHLSSQLKSRPLGSCCQIPHFSKGSRKIAVHWCFTWDGTSFILVREAIIQTSK